jgi:hypothetical protein
VELAGPINCHVLHSLAVSSYPAMSDIMRDGLLYTEYMQKRAVKDVRRVWAPMGHFAWESAHRETFVFIYAADPVPKMAKFACQSMYSLS